MLDMSGLVCGKTGDKTMSHIAYILLIPFTLLGCLVGLQLKYKFGFNWLEIAINTMNMIYEIDTMDAINTIKTINVKNTLSTIIRINTINIKNNIKQIQRRK